MNAVANAQYSRGDADISITQLLDPPRKVALERIYEDVLEADVSDQIFSLMGQAMHTILERGGVATQSEQRLYADIGGWRVSGQFDYIDDEGILWDWKFVSVWEAMNGVKQGREDQLNAYAYLASANELQVRGLCVGFIFRDWKASDSKLSGYPSSQVWTYGVKLRSLCDTKSFLDERVRLHQEAREQLPECTPEERWARPDTYAVIKAGGKRATKVFQKQADAALFAGAKGSSYAVELRPGTNTRCESYCDVSAYCEQFKRLKREANH